MMRYFKYQKKSCIAGKRSLAYSSSNNEFVGRKRKLLAFAGVLGSAVPVPAFFVSVAGTVPLSLSISNLIASESFSVPPYTDALSFGNTNNSRGNVGGTTGFSSTDLWERNTANVTSRAGGGLTHALVVGRAMDGYALSRPGTADRICYRDLKQAPEGSSFYMSGLVSMQGNLTNVLDNGMAVMGLSARSLLSAEDLSSGLFLGLTRGAGSDVFLSALAGGPIYTLGSALTPAQAGGAHLIILRVDIGAGATDKLFAWIAMDGATEVTFAGSWIGLDIADSGEDLRMFGVASIRSGIGTSFGAALDEWRFFGTSSQDPRTSFWVSSNGDDFTGTGTAGAPWATISKARDYIRTMGLNTKMVSDITVNISAGTYILTNTLAFSSSDSGDNGNFIIYRAADGPGTVHLLGSADVNGWTFFSGLVWKVNIGINKTIDSIFENNVRGHLARLPNHIPDPSFPQHHAPYFISVKGGKVVGSVTNDWIEYNSAGYADVFCITNFTSAARVVWWIQGGTKNWSMATSPVIVSNDTTKRRLYFTDLSESYWPGAKERYFIAGVQSLLDAPGEFYYEKTDGWLYYMPRSGEDPSLEDIRIPLTIPSLIAVQGCGPGVRAHHLKFEGLRFAYTSGNADKGALNLQHTDHIEVRDCHFINTGRYAILMNQDNSRNLVYGCWIEHCGVGGVIVRNSLKRSEYPDDRSEFNTISNCKIHDVGEMFISSGLTAGVALLNTSDCEVSHCVIYNSGRYAISLRGHYSTQWVTRDNGYHFARNNTFRHIQASNCMNDSGDGAVVHAAHCNGSEDPSGTNNVNYWNQIQISGAYAHPSMDDVPPNGIFFDHPNSCLYQNLSNIRIERIPNSLYRGNNNPVESQTTSNVNFTGIFDESLMQYSLIGLKTDFPSIYE